jgi:hypothetical protein
MPAAPSLQHYDEEEMLFGHGGMRQTIQIVFLLARDSRKKNKHQQMMHQK